MNQQQADREKAVHLRRLGHDTAAVAAELGYSPQWVRKWWRRYQASGWAGLAGQTRAPHQHGKRVDNQVRRAVVKARSGLEAEANRNEGLKYIGGRAVRTRLKGTVSPLPSVATIERVLRAEGLTRPREEKTEIIYPRLKPQQAQQLYQVDHIPRYLQGGRKVYCFNAIDVVSRYPTGQVYAHRRATDARDFLIHLWQTVGIPAYTQLDNEACFSGGFTHPYVLGQCVRLALLVGTQLVFSPVRHPKSNGTVERFHQDYQLHVWQDTYLRDLTAVQNQAEQFFSQYRHSEHHTALQGETPTMRHQGTTVTRLPEDFSTPEGKLPLYAGQVHFMRRVHPDGTISVLNVDWTVPNPDPLRGVWVTLELTPDQTTLAIYDTAPDVPGRTCLVTYPFPLKEPVLAHPAAPSVQEHQSQSIDEPQPNPDNRSTEDVAASFELWRWLPKHLPDLVRHPPRHFIRASLIHTANFVRNVAETMF